MDDLSDENSASGIHQGPDREPRRRVLIVEDEGLIALDLKRRLERSGYTITGIAGSAEEALESVRREVPDIVLMDIRLRGPQDGVETAHQLRREFNLPVLFVTAHADRATLERARLAEPFGYIVKPFTATNFEPKIEMAIWKNAMEQRLRESERWLSETMRHAGDGILTTGATGRIVTANPAAELLIGREVRALAGELLCDVLPLREPRTGAPVLQPEVMSILSTGRGNTVLLDPAGMRGRRIECTIASSLENRTPLGLIVILRDITERIKAAEYEKQRQKMQALALLATGAGRELQDPLRLIAAHTEECLHDAKGASVHDLRQIYRATSRAQALVQQLAQMGRQEESGADPVDLCAAIASLRPRMKKLFGRRQTLRFSLQPGLPPIFVNPQGLADSLMTLTMGAQQVAGAEGWVEIATTLEDSGMVRIAVSDSGPAISERARPRVFEPYYHSRAGQPDGMSLALVHHFVTVNNGLIETSQSAAGVNSFCLRFPAMTATEDCAS